MIHSKQSSQVPKILNIVSSLNRIETHRLLKISRNHNYFEAQRATYKYLEIKDQT